ncbi:MAG: glycosyltransferase family 39 protein [Elusimicrobiota bacterium]|jgi:hypothetical protein
MSAAKNAPCPCGSGRKFKSCCMFRAPESSSPEGGVSRWAFRALFGALAVVYVLALRSYFVGYFNDDAFYLIGAKSLLQGRYVQLHAPTEAAFIQYLPGYPLLLAPLLAFFAETSVVLQLYSILLLCAALVLLERLWRASSSSGVRFAALALFGASPIAVSLSGAVLAEGPYLLWTALVFTALSRVWERDDAKTWLLVGALAGYGALLRPNGICLPVSAALALLFSGRFRSAAVCLSAGLAPVGGFYLRNVFHAGLGTVYLGELRAPFAGGEAGLAQAWTLVGGNAWFYLRAVFVKVFLSWPEPFASGVLGALTVAVGAAAALRGARREGEAGWERCARIHVALYAAVLLVWFKQAPRYLLPILPFVFLYLFRGLESWTRRLPARAASSVLWGALAAGLLLCAPLNVHHLRASLYWATPVNTPALNTFRWIRENTRPDEVFAAEMQGRLYLYTGRRGWRIPKVEAPLELARWARGSGVTRILSASADASMPTVTRTASGEALAQPLLERLLSDSRFFEKDFTDARERTAVYRVLP